MFAARNTLMTRPAAAPGDGLTSWGYASFTASVTPGDITPIALNANAPAVSVDSNARLTSASATVDGTYYSAGRGPAMAAGLYWVKAGNGGAATSTDRGFGSGYSNADGTTAIFFISYQSSGQIYTALAGAVSSRATHSSAGSNSGSDVNELRYAVVGADVVYTVYKNGSPTSLTYTDTGAALVGTPGRYPIGVVRRIRSAGANYPPPGIDLLQAGMS